MPSMWALAAPFVLFTLAAWAMGLAQAALLRERTPRAARWMGACLALGVLLCATLWLLRPSVVHVLPATGPELALRILQAVGAGAFVGACTGALAGWMSPRRPPRAVPA